jgi:hypothetical protein
MGYMEQARISPSDDATVGAPRVFGISDTHRARRSNAFRAPVPAAASITAVEGVATGLALKMVVAAIRHRGCRPCTKAGHDRADQALHLGPFGSIVFDENA